MQRFFRKLSRRRTLERELEDELAFHREMAEAGGNSTPLGNLLRIKEASGDPWRFTLLESLWRDAVYGVRGLSRTPMLALIAVLAVALGVGSTTAVFSLVNAVLLKPVPVPDPDSLVELQPAATPSKFAAWREQSGVLQDVSAYMPGSWNYAGGDTVEQVQSMQMSAGALHCWGIRILRGRAFTPQEDLPGGPRVTLLGEGFWQRRFAGDPQVLGKTVSLNGEAHTVIGIAADSSFLLEQDGLPDVYVPFQLDLNSADQTLRFRVTARLKSGVTLKRANTELQVSADAYRTKFPGGLGPKEGFSAEPYRDYLIAGNRPLLMVLAGAVGLVLLIACTNVANLQLVRAEGRRREIAIRVAIGAGRARVIRQLLTERLLLALAGGALGTLLGFAGMRALLAIDTARLPRVGDGGIAVGIDWRVLVFALGSSVLTGIVFGALPAIQASRVDLAAMQVSGPRHNKTRAALVVCEVTLAVILLIGSALLIRTFVALYSVDRGFDAKNVITMRMKMTGAKFQGDRFQKAAVLADSMRDGLERIRALPGVESATATYFIPLQTAIAVNFDIAGQAFVERPLVGWTPVASGYFDVFQIPVTRGRTFNDRDDGAALPVVVISESMAKAYWGDADPLGDRIAIGRGRPQFRNEPARQIIGVVGDVRDRQLYYKPQPTMYVPQAQITDAMNAFLVRIQPMAWIVRARDQPRALAPAIKEQLRQATALPVMEVRSMDQVVSASTARQRFNMLLMTVFGSAALLLAAVGVYGLMAYSVEQRTREIGIRLALGAEASRVKQRVIFEGMRLALAGVVIGIGAAAELAHFLASFLYGVPARDPSVFIAVPTVLSVVALLAVWAPATRASRIDPLTALRYE
jgi:putative ABC transport system permease protein